MSQTHSQVAARFPVHQVSFHDPIATDTSPSPSGHVLPSFYTRSTPSYKLPLEYNLLLTQKANELSTSTSSPVLRKLELRKGD
jgi:hypothetical protein